MSIESKHIEWNRRELQFRKELRGSFSAYSSHVMPSIEMTPFHLTYYNILERFAKGDIKRLIITVPPQHGKSLGSSELLPPYILGIRPDARVAIASYSATLADRFNKRAQRILNSAEYVRVFETRTKSTIGVKEAGNFAQTSSYVEIVDRLGSLMSVGRGGSLTGNRVDVMIMDDLYKDAMEGNSPLIRENTWEWYNSVVRTRLHKDSQELIVFTRWHEDDLIGRLLSSSEGGSWQYVNFEAIKTSPPTDLDPRKEGEVLWESRHDRESLDAKRALDLVTFECMYQGNPTSAEGQLYGNNFGTYTTLPKTVKKGNYTDTADMGEDYLCSMCYEVDSNGIIYVTDVLYTQESMEVTEGAVAMMLQRNDTRVAKIESNNGGRGFARAVQRGAPNVRVEWFHQSDNKEARILTNSPTVLQRLRFPSDWQIRWSKLYEHVTQYKRLYKANRYHDAVDVITGIIEMETAKGVDYGKLAELQKKLAGISI